MIRNHSTPGCTPFSCCCKSNPLIPVSVSKSRIIKYSAKVGIASVLTLCFKNGRNDGYFSVLKHMPEIIKTEAYGKNISNREDRSSTCALLSRGLYQSLLRCQVLQCVLFVLT